MSKKNRWAANSEWHSIVVVTPTGNTVVLRPDTAVYLSTKKRSLMVVTVQDILEGLFQISVRMEEEDPWQYAVKCVSSMVMVKKMAIHNPDTGKLMGYASLTPPRSKMH